MPAPFVPLPNGALLVLHFDATLTPFSNTFYFLKEATWEVEDLQLLADAAMDNWGEILASSTTAAAKLNSATAYDASAIDGAVYQSFVGAPIVGTRGGNPVGLNMALSVKRRAIGRGRSFRGRAFHYGLTSNDLATEIAWSASVASAVATQYAVFAAALADASGSTPVLAQKKAGGAWLEEAVPHEIVAWVGATKVATKRKRIPL